MHIFTTLGVVVVVFAVIAAALRSIILSSDRAETIRAVRSLNRFFFVLVAIFSLIVVARLIEIFA